MIKNMKPKEVIIEIEKSYLFRFPGNLLLELWIGQRLKNKLLRTFKVKHRPMQHFFESE